MHLLRTTFATLTALAVFAANAQERLPTVPAGRYSPEQREAATEFEAARKGPVFGPFEPMMNSPQMMSRARAMGDYLRFKSALGNTLSELVILVTAREWSQDYEWSYHYPIAVKVGIRPEVIDAIAEGHRPVTLSADEETVYNFVTELLTTKKVSDTSFERAKARFGAKGVVDMTGLVGYYTLLALQLNVAQYPMVKDGRRLPALAH